MLGLVRAEMTVVPLSHRLQAALSHWLDCAGRHPATSVQDLAAATLQLERAMLVPCQVPREPAPLPPLALFKLRTNMD